MLPMRHCNTGRTCYIITLLPQDNTLSYLYTLFRKLQYTCPENRYSVVAPSDGAEKNLNMGAQLQIIPYKNPPKHF